MVVVWCVLGLVAVGVSPAVARAPVSGAARAGLASSIKWKRCGVRLDCARVRVPLVWADPGGANITLAVIRHLASKPRERIGTLFFNPGGPGVSGVDSLKDAFTSRLLDQAGGGRFDVVSWDIRGSGASTHVTCFRDEQSARRFWGGADGTDDGGGVAALPGQGDRVCAALRSAQRQSALAHLHS